MLTLWNEARTSDGGRPQPQAHRLILEAPGDEERKGRGEHLRERYIESVAAHDLEEEAVPTLVGWIRERPRAHHPLDAWMRALRAASGGTRGGAAKAAPAVATSPSASATADGRRDGAGASRPLGSTTQTASLPRADTRSAQSRRPSACRAAPSRTGSPHSG